MENINISIQENIKLDDALLNIRLIDMYCKHVIKNNMIENSKINKLLIASKKIHYNFCEWGSHQDHSNDLVYHQNIIKKMEQDQYNPAIRIVICKYEFCNTPIIWADNLHSTIKYIRKYGKDVKLKDVPFYIVDVQNLDKPIIASCKENILRTNKTDILGAVSSAYYRYEMSNSCDIINTNYLIKDFLDDNPELYTDHNLHIGHIKNNDSVQDILEKSQAFNSLWNYKNYNQQFDDFER